MANELSASLPKIILSQANSGGVASATFPKITLVNPLGGGILDTTLKKIALLSTGWIDGAVIELPLIVLDATSDTGNVYLTLPIVKVSGSMRRDTTGVGEINLPIQTLSGFSAGIVNLTLPKIALVASGVTLSTGSATISLPIVELLVSGFTGVVGNALITLPIIQVSGTGHDVIGGIANITLPKIELLASALAENYKCIVINLFNGVITEYTNFEFDSLVELEGAIYGINSNGIYLLGGDTDITTDITASFQTFLTDYGLNNDKNLADCVIGLRSDGQVTVESIYSDATGRSSTIVSTSDVMTDKRASLGRKGTASRFVGNKVTNVSGADFSIDSIYQEILIHKRGKRINE